MKLTRKWIVLVLSFLKQKNREPPVSRIPVRTHNVFTILKHKVRHYRKIYNSLPQLLGLMYMYTLCDNSTQCYVYIDSYN